MATSNATLMALRLPSSIFRQEKHGHQYGGNWIQVAPGKFLVRAQSASAMPSQRGDTARAEILKELNKLLEDVAKTAVSTGPRGAIHLAQGIEAVVPASDKFGSYNFSEHRTRSSFESPWASRARRLFEKLEATYTKLDQFIASAPTLFLAAYVKEFKVALVIRHLCHFNISKPSFTRNLVAL